MRITRWGGAVVLGAALGAAALAGPAAAQDGHFPDAGWDVRQITTGGDWEPATASDITSSSTVELVKPDGATGTSIETTNLELEVAAGDVISVSYQLDGADFAAGAVRLFWYDTPNADTLTVGPTAFAAADAMSGTLSLDIGADAQVGTLGLVYDASNASAGTVRLSDLTVGKTEVLFQEPAAPSPSPTPDPTGKPTPDPEPSDPAAPGQGGEKPGLPVTGTSVPVLVGGGAMAAGLGGLALWLTRRRRAVSFTA